MNSSNSVLILGQQVLRFIYYYYYYLGSILSLRQAHTNKLRQVNKKVVVYISYQTDRQDRIWNHNRPVMLVVMMVDTPSNSSPQN